MSEKNLDDYKRTGLTDKKPMEGIPGDDVPNSEHSVSRDEAEKGLAAHLT